MNFETPYRQFHQRQVLHSIRACLFLTLVPIGLRQSQKRVGHLGSLLEDVLVDDSKNPLDAESQYVNFDSSAPGMRRTDFSPEHLSLRGQAPCRRPLGKTFMCTPLFQPRELPLALLQNSLHYLVRLPPTPVSCCESSFLRLSGFAKPTLLLLLLLHSHSWR